MTTTDDLLSTLKRIEAELVHERQRRRMDRKLKERATRFKDEFQLLDRPDDAVGLQITAVPVSEDLSLQPLSKPYGQIIDDLPRPRKKLLRLFKETQLEVISPPDFDHTFSPSGWDSILRAVRSDNHRRITTKKGVVLPLTYSYLELHRDGIVEFGFLSCMKLGGSRDGQRGHLMLFPDHAVVAMATVLSWVLSLCRLAERSDIEYLVQTNIHTIAEKTLLYPPGPERTRVYGLEMGEIKRGVTTLPNIPFTSSVKITALLSTIEHDLVNAGSNEYSTNQYGEFELLDSA